MKLRRLNGEGCKRFASYLEAARADPGMAPPSEILDDDEFSSGLPNVIEADEATFADRLEFVQWLDGAATAAGAEIPSTDVGFWAWLTLKLFDQVCPQEGKVREIREEARYIPDPQSYRRSHRHVLRTSWEVFQIHRDDVGRADLILRMPLKTLGELTEQFASRQDIISCPGTMALASRLFWDSVAGKPKPGAGGSVGRRFAKLLNQYQRTWDIAVMKPEQSEAILPPEFDRFRF